MRNKPRNFPLPVMLSSTASGTAPSRFWISKTSQIKMIFLVYSMMLLVCSIWTPKASMECKDCNIWIQNKATGSELQHKFSLHCCWSPTIYPPDIHQLHSIPLCDTVKCLLFLDCNNIRWYLKSWEQVGMPREFNKLKPVTRILGKAYTAYVKMKYFYWLLFFSISTLCHWAMSPALIKRIFLLREEKKNGLIIRMGFRMEQL